MDKIFNELAAMWDGTDKKAVSSLIHKLCGSKDNIVVGLGAGRMGYSVQSFVMRLSHLGYKAYMIGDTTTPRIGKDTIAIVNTSSGETPTMRLYVDQCKEAQSFVIAVLQLRRHT